MEDGTYIVMFDDNIVKYISIVKSNELCLKMKNAPAKVYNYMCSKHLNFVNEQVLVLLPFL